jgi:hypothetical protein
MNHLPTKRSTTILLVTGVLCCAAMVTSELVRATTAQHALSHAESSADRLIHKLLDALAKRDPDALRRLRVTEAEYREILLPGNVPEGQPLRPPSKELADLAWGLIETKSPYHEAVMLKKFGGLDLEVESVGFEDGVKRYANHVLHQQLRLRLKDVATGAHVELETGSIVEMSGRYKFASFIAD